MNHRLDMDAPSLRPKTASTSKKRRRNTHTQMKVKKRNGSFETVDLNKIVKAVDRCCDGLYYVISSSCNQNNLWSL